MTYVVPSRGYHYDGDFVNGQRHGVGVYTFPSGNRYVGEFMDNEIHGTGTLYGPDGVILKQGRWAHYNFVESA